MEFVNQPTIHPALGTHIVADLYSCKNLDNNDFVQKILLEAAHISKGTILHTQFHKFEPVGLTGYILLAESHISIHTWPELEYAAIDVFTCGDTMKPTDAVKYIEEKLQVKNTKMQIISRSGVLKHE